MGSASGLQRRRGAGTSSLAAFDDEDSLARTPKQVASSAQGGAGKGKQAARVEQHSGSGSVATIDVGTGHKLAYDPRDMDDADEERSCPRLTIMEEVLLLGLKDAQGYLSFWNDKLSYTLRGSILMELALRNRIAIMPGADQKRVEVADRLISVKNRKGTGEPLLDEALRHIQQGPPASVSEWMDLLSGETWNMMKLNMQLKQVRERLAKGLVEKGVLRTEKRNFLLFDMPTHPLSNTAVKDAVRRRVYALTTSRSIHPEALYKEDANNGPIDAPVTRALCMVCSAHCGNVLENVLQHLSSDSREEVEVHFDYIAEEFGQWPMAPTSSTGGLPPRGTTDAILARPVNVAAARMSFKNGRTSKLGVSVDELARHMLKEYDTAGRASAYEVIAAVLHVFIRMDSLI
ncbi:retrograde vesicle-mediated transporter [Malassezia pachydermatis]|uniref:Vacuolar protein sorting-associated protein 74 n=1 Tax=Malassezia pachydermatis TaxID=77020 RepID=A0A0M8MRW3_9BASI|nr:vacuolar protein sorting-associated protein 74 [Malassezia pachydermatis]KOS15537.1 vacuolar protein sorting-associated protein 74 [Malassezia pachydermatis]